MVAQVPKLGLNRANEPSGIVAHLVISAPHIAIRLPAHVIHNELGPKQGKLLLNRPQLLPVADDFKAGQQGQESLMDQTNRLAISVINREFPGQRRRAFDRIRDRSILTCHVVRSP